MYFCDIHFLRYINELSNHPDLMHSIKTFTNDHMEGVRVAI